MTEALYPKKSITAILILEQPRNIAPKKNVVEFEKHLIETDAFLFFLSNGQKIIGIFGFLLAVLLEFLKNNKN